MQIELVWRKITDPYCWQVITPPPPLVGWRFRQACMAAGNLTRPAAGAGNRLTNWRLFLGNSEVFRRRNEKFDINPVIYVKGLWYRIFGAASAEWVQNCFVGQRPLSPQCTWCMPHGWLTNYRTAMGTDHLHNVTLSFFSDSAGQNLHSSGSV